MHRVILAIGLVLVALPATADECLPCPPPEPPPPVWIGSIDFSYLATAGNSEAKTFGLATRWARQPTPWGAELEALANRAESGGAKTAERIFGGVRSKRAVGDRYELFAGLSYERDQFAGFDSRVVLETGGLQRVLTGPVHELNFDLGLTWTREEPVTGPGSDYVGGIAGARYAWKINNSATFRERLVLYPDFEDSSDWRLRSETSLETALASSWALRVSYLLTRDNVPPPGFEKDDSATSVSLVWKR